MSGNPDNSTGLPNSDKKAYSLPPILQKTGVFSIFSILKMKTIKVGYSSLNYGYFSSDYPHQSRKTSLTG